MLYAPLTAESERSGVIVPLIESIVKDRPESKAIVPPGSVAAVEPIWP